MEEEEDITSDLFTAVGEQIKVLRIRAGLTQREFGRLVGYTESQISSIERGVRVPQPDFLEKADKILNAGGLLLVVKKSIEKAQAKARVRHPGWFRGYAMLEAMAVQLYVYTNQLIPGLLQTEDYARAVFTQRRPLLSDEVIEKRVADRLARQQIFEPWPSPTFSFVLDESVLLRPVGGAAVHKEQLRKLLRVGRMRTVELQVMPLTREEQPSMDGPFTLVTPKGRRQVAYLEHQGYPRLITEEEEVRLLDIRYGIIRAQALTPRDTLALIEKMLGDA
ncbi:helix-turn-helix transcriptional regulator [Streptomyces melanogenes]|uniref:Helix-turn-helix transcriptional regulator n=1 Tax=Streptomyces melanogenes TaxID=67326 RepID=A0ABZ1XME0_9ACTN|nr:helix-turn-helix transcriptional regulator [Streptomyces melanogenes]